MTPNRIDGVEIPKGYATIPSFKLERGLVRGWKSRQEEVEALVDALVDVLHQSCGIGQKPEYYCDEGTSAYEDGFLLLDSMGLAKWVKKRGWKLNWKLIAKYKGEIE